MERKDCNGYTLWLFNVAMENHIFVIGKPSINGAFSMAMLNNQRVYTCYLFKRPSEIFPLFMVGDALGYPSLAWNQSIEDEAQLPPGSL